TAHARAVQATLEAKPEDVATRGSVDDQLGRSLGRHGKVAFAAELERLELDPNLVSMLLTRPEAELAQRVDRHGLSVAAVAQRLLGVAHARGQRRTLGSRSVAGKGRPLRSFRGSVEPTPRWACATAWNVSGAWAGNDGAVRSRKDAVRRRLPRRGIRYTR